MIFVVLIFLFLISVILPNFANILLGQTAISRTILESKKSYFLAEAGVEDILYRIKNGLEYETDNTLDLDGGQVTTTVIDDINTKTISATSNFRNLIRNIDLEIIAGVGSSFSYGVQSGNGGFVLNNNAVVNGSVYSNGSILGSSGAKITGSAISASDGEVNGLVSNVIVGEDGVGDANAYEVVDSTIEGNLYCQIGSGNNKVCNASNPPLGPREFSITDAMITDWKNEAEEGETYNGDYTVNSSETLGPLKINGDLIINNNKTLTMSGTIWVTGNIEMKNGSFIVLDEIYGAGSGVLVTDGTIDIGNNTTFVGSGEAGSYIMALTTSVCPYDTDCDGDDAIEVNNNIEAVILNAQKGTLRMNNNSNAKQITALTIILDQNVEINYETGMSDSSFVNGPTGDWTISSWREIE